MNSAGAFAVRNSKDVFAFLIFTSDDPLFGAHPDVEEQYTRTAAVFADGGWEVPRLREAMRCAKDLFFDTVSQIRMPVWSRGAWPWLVMPHMRRHSGPASAPACAYRRPCACR
jgi:hypothetical protein